MTERAVEERVTVFCLMTPRPGKAETLRTSLMALVQPTREETGCVAYDVYQEPDGSLVLLEKWGSEQEFAAHQGQPAIRAFFGDKLGDLLADDMSVHYGSLLSPTD